MNTLSYNFRKHLEAELAEPLRLDDFWQSFQTQNQQHRPRDFLDYLAQHGQLSGEQLEVLTATHGESGYDFLKVVGEGAMGQIHLVSERNLQRHVALKTLREEVISDRIALGRFLNEVQITAQLNHPNIVPIYSLEDMDGNLAYTMKLVQGKDLKEIVQATQKRVKAQGYSPETHNFERLLDYFLKVCEAIHYAHSKGVIHRDLKPANVMVGPYQEVYVMDWGIARIMGGKADETPAKDTVEAAQRVSSVNEGLDLTQTGQILGTPRYMSPEQIRAPSHRLDGRSDVFALGAILYELVTLKTAFRAKSIPEVLKKILTGKYEPLTWPDPDRPVPHELEGIIHKALKVKRAERYASVKEMVEDIQRYRQGQAVLAAPDTPMQALRRAVNTHRQLLLNGMLSLVVISAMVTVGILFKEARDLEAAKYRKDRIGELVNDISQRAQNVDRGFLSVQNRVWELNALALQRLDQPTPPQAKVYLSQAFDPPDLAPTQRYGAQTSFDWPIVVANASQPQGKYLESAKKLSPLGPYLRSLLLRTGGYWGPRSDAEERKILEEAPLTVLWGTVVLSQENMAFWYPGVDISAERSQSYQAIERPFYTAAAGKPGVRLAPPYVDATSGELIFAMVSALKHPQKGYIGTAGVDLQPAQLIQRYLNIPAELGVTRIAIVNEQGAEIVVGERNASGELSSQQSDGKQLLQHSEVREALRSGLSGWVEKKNKIWIYYPLPTVSWGLVAECDLNSLLQGGAP